jgi:tRNA dimethylallyltransferase
MQIQYLFANLLMINYEKPIIVIAGPTASGKSSLAIKLAKDINGYVINADSRQIYQGLQIGTAQPIPDSVEDNRWVIDGIDHYLYGHVNPKSAYNIFEYQKDVQKILDTVNQKDASKVPILAEEQGCI